MKAEGEWGEQQREREGKSYNSDKRQNSGKYVIRIFERKKSWRDETGGK